MSSRTLEKRIERVERALKAKQVFAPECICFPANERLFVAFQVELKMAIALKCPLHGARFKPPKFQIYVSKWLRDKRWQLLWTHYSEQYRKAWFATFPPDLWPAQETMEQQRLILKLKDGTKLFA